MVKYKITLYNTDYTTIDGEYKKIETAASGECSSWDDVQNLLGYYTETFGEAKFKIAVEKEDK